MSRILFVAAEGLPFCKSGGLADVIGSLPQALRQEQEEVRVVLPLYLGIAQKHRHTFTERSRFEIDFGYFHSVVTIFEKEVDGIVYYFVEHGPYFERDALYGYPDDGERFSFFQIAVLEMLRHLEYFPEIIHSHDWHAGMIPVLAKVKYADDARYQAIKHIYTIHNLAYQGYFPKEVLGSCLGLPMSLFENGSLQFQDGISFMKGGILYADKVTTVSRTYAQEILTPQFGERMDRVLEMRKGDLSGIVNGLDIEMWDPKTDTNLVHPQTSRAAKIKNKLALQERLGLRQSKDVMLVSLVTRLTWQKGLYLLLDKIEEVLANDVQLVILGNGDTQIENTLKEIEYKYKRRVCFYCGYNEALAHQIYAGSDLFVMPSLFEPCGISQLIAMRYQTIPLVRETGGLKDTVIPYNEYTKEGFGFTFAPYQSSDFLYTFKRAVDFYYDKQDDWAIMMKQAGKQDVSWQKSAQEYCKLYSDLLNQ